VTVGREFGSQREVGILVAQGNVEAGGNEGVTKDSDELKVRGPKGDVGVGS